MKKIKYIIGILVLIIGGAYYGAETYLGIDLMDYLSPDVTEPVIDSSSVNTKIVVDQLFDLDDVTCKDDRDDTCTVIISGSIDVTIPGIYELTLQAADKAGNKATETINIEVLEGIDTTFYIPDGYYNGIEGLTGLSLKDTLNDIITGQTELPYTSTNTDVWDMLRAADEDPENPDNVILFYSGISWPKNCQDTNTNLLPDICFVDEDRDNDYTEWNREHIWSKSHGDFEDEDGYEFEESSGSYAMGAHTDGHHLVAAERTMNSIKNNRFFDDCHDLTKYDSNNDGVINEDDDIVDRGEGNYTCGEWFFEPRDEVKGDVARMLFYMAVRYDGEDGDYVDLELTADFDSISLGEAIKNSKLPYYADLEVLLQWHLEDPVSEWEINRNQVIYTFQGNRNPFIDMPELVALVWGTPEAPVVYN